MGKKKSVIYILHSVLISAFVLALYLFWFVFSDRRLTFLYGHLQSTPFDQITIGRYWVTGLVASGAVLIVYTTGNLLVRAFRRGYRLPEWSVVWQYVCLLLALPIFAIVAFIGKPSMPVLLSLWILIVLMSSLALALCASHFIVTRFRQAVWLFFDGLALVPPLVLLPLAIAFFLRRQTVPLATMIIIPLIIVGASFSWFWIMTLLHKRFNQPYPSALSITLSGVITAYILAPICHYLTSSEYIYISSSTNFLSNNIWLQGTTFAIVAALVWWIAWRRGKGNEGFGFIKVLLFVFMLCALSNFLVNPLMADEETDAWLCKDGQWVMQGTPSYLKPFDEDC